VARYGLVGVLIGAVIGGVGSFLGAYMTYKAQTETHSEDVRSGAYATLVADTQEFRADLRDVADAAKAKDERTYVKARVRLIQLANDVYRSATTVYILSENEQVVTAANGVTKVLFENPPVEEPIEVEEAEPERLLATLGESARALSAFLAAARADLTE
jgi:hypothetical protein